jgi:acyl-CoA thioesterase-1
VPYTKITKQRRSISKVAAVIAFSCVLVAVGLGIMGLVLQQRERLAENAAAAENFSPAEATFAPKLPGVAFIGDSYTQGAGADSEGAPWPTLLSRSEDWAERNLGRGGTGYISTSTVAGCGLEYCPNYSEMIPEAVTLNPSKVVVSGGRNDVGQDPEAVTEAINSFYEDLRAQLPDAEIIAISPVWDAREAPEEIDRMRDAVRAAAEANGAEYLDIGQPLAGQPDLVAPDEVHPNNEGHAALAEAARTSLR